MKTFESLFAELSEKADTKQAGSLTVDELNKGTHFIGKKIVEEASETWIAAEYEGAGVPRACGDDPRRTANRRRAVRCSPRMRG